MTESLGSAVLDLSTDQSKLDAGLGKAESTTKSKMGRIGGLIAKGAAAGAAALAGAGIAAFGAAMKVSSFGDELDKTSQKVGVSTQALQEMRFWADQNGISSSNMDRALGRLNQRIGDGTAGSSKYVDALNSLGVKTVDTSGKARDAEAVFRDSVAALSEVESATERSALAAEIYGTKLGRELMPGLNAGAEGLDAAAKKMKIIGTVTDEQIAASTEFQDNWGFLTTAVGSFLRDAAFPLVGFFNDTLYPILLETVLPAIREVIDAFGEGGLAGGFAKVGEIFADIGPGLLDSIQDIMRSILDFVVNNVDNIVEFLLDGREAFFNAAIQVFESLVQALPEIVPRVIEALLSMVQTLVDTLVLAVPLLVQGALTLLLGLVDGIIAALPAILDAAVEIIMTLLDALVVALPDVIDAGIELILALVDGLIIALPELSEFLISDLIPQLLDALLVALPQLLDAGMLLILALLDGMVENSPMIAEMIVTDLIPALVVALVQSQVLIQKAALKLMLSLLDGLTGGFASDVAGWFRRLPGNIRDFFSNAGDWLVNAGKTIMRGLLGGIKDAFGEVTDFVGGIGSTITSLKGPLPDDQVMLIPAGEAIMQGLQDGLEAEMGALEATLGGVTSTIMASISADDILGGDDDFGGHGGITVQELNVQAWSDRFDFGQVTDELALRGAV